MGKRTGGLGTASSDHRKIRSIVDDLTLIKAELLPDDKHGGSNSAELKNMDDFQRKRHQLSVLLDKLRTDIDRLNDIRKSKPDADRDPMCIRMQSDNNKAIKDATQLFSECMEIMKKDEKKKKKIDEQDLRDRHKLLELESERLKQLAMENSRVRPNISSEEENIQKRRDIRRKKEKEDREARRARREQGDGKKKKGDQFDINDDDFKVVGPQSDQELQFEDQVANNMKQQDELLDAIIQGIDSLKVIAEEANKQLAVQDIMIHQVDQKIDQTIQQFQTVNKRMKNLLDDSGGLSRWCPILICCVILLALIGYMFHIEG